ncbi:hypothetical protein J6253_01000 [bacterium]|jgi:hypothetical protein|nr:hypothetical protein [bacterium]
MNKIKNLILISLLLSIFTIAAKEKDEDRPQNKFSVNIQYSQTSGFIPAADILWHYTSDIFSSLYGNYYIAAEKKSLENYEKSKYALFSKTFVIGADVIGFYAAKKPAFFAVSAGVEYKRVKNEEFGFFDLEDSTVTFEDTTLLDMIFPFLKLRIDKYTERLNNRFLFVFYPTYCLFTDQTLFFDPLTLRVYETDSVKWQVPAIELSEEVLFSFSPFGGILLSGSFSFWQAKYKSAVLKKRSGKYIFDKVGVTQNFLEYAASMSYVLPFEIAGKIRPKLGAGILGSTEFRENDGRKSTHKDIGYLIVAGFYY